MAPKGIDLILFKLQRNNHTVKCDQRSDDPPPSNRSIQNMQDFIHSEYSTIRKSSWSITEVCTILRDFEYAITEDCQKLFREEYKHYKCCLIRYFCSWQVSAMVSKEEKRYTRDYIWAVLSPWS